MRIATWNLERPKKGSWKKRPPVEAKIQEVGADIWVLTETNDCIRPRDAVDCERSKTVEGLHGDGESLATIWSRWPIQRRLNTHDPERAVCVEIEAEGERWLVYGTVLPYLGEGGEVHDESIRQHVDEWTRLRKRRPQHRFVVAADFNESLAPRQDRHHYGTTNGRRLLREGLERAELKCATDTVDIEINQLKAANIDHICLDSESYARSWRIDKWSGTAKDGVKMSDHIGLCLDLPQPAP